MCCSYSDLWSVYLSETVIVICSYEYKYPVKPVINPKPVYRHPYTGQYLERGKRTNLGTLSTRDGVRIDILGSIYRESCVYGSNGVCW
jgi:hypothetical protein